MHRTGRRIAFGFAVAAALLLVGLVSMWPSVSTETAPVDPPPAPRAVSSVVLAAQPDAADIRYQERLLPRPSPGIPHPPTESDSAQLRDWTQFELGSQTCRAQIVNFELGAADCTGGLGLHREHPVTPPAWFWISLAAAGFALVGSWVWADRSFARNATPPLRL